MKGKVKTIKGNNSKGITLVALVVTIIVLLILAGVTIMTLFGENGLISMADKARRETENAQANDAQGIDSLVDQMGETLGEAPKIGTKYIGKVLNSDKNKNLVDSYGNKITIPAGFKIVPNGESNVEYKYSGDGIPTVQDGIVIEHGTDRNQFVWVPVNDIKNKDGSTTTIKLGRYSNFTVTDGVLPTPEQEATTSSYNTPVAISDYYFEVGDKFKGNETYKSASQYGNTKATNLQEWITTTLANGGYYIARYETSQNGTKAASVAGKTVWASITQPNAAIAAKATYPAPENNTTGYTYYSDLINSYAWDTAIIFIEAYAQSDYADDNKSTSFGATGTNPDKVCNIHDMSGNAYEWSTEASTHSRSSYAYPCTLRGGCYSTNNGSTVYSASYRGSLTTVFSYSIDSFRLTLYVK